MGGGILKIITTFWVLVIFWFNKDFYSIVYKPICINLTNQFEKKIYYINHNKLNILYYRFVYINFQSKDPASAPGIYNKLIFFYLNHAIHYSDHGTNMVAQNTLRPCKGNQAFFLKIVSNLQLLSMLTTAFNRSNDLFHSTREHHILCYSLIVKWLTLTFYIDEDECRAGLHAGLIIFIFFNVT